MVHVLLHLSWPPSLRPEHLNGVGGGVECTACVGVHFLFVVGDQGSESGLFLGPHGGGVAQHAGTAEDKAARELIVVVADAEDEPPHHRAFRPACEERMRRENPERG